MLPDGWTGLGRVLVIGPAAYLAMVLLLRASGKRTLTKLNLFDFVVTVALGSTLASVILTKSVGLMQGIAAFAVEKRPSRIVWWHLTQCLSSGIAAWPVSS